MSCACDDDPVPICTSEAFIAPADLLKTPSVLYKLCIGRISCIMVWICIWQPSNSSIHLGWKVLALSTYHLNQTFLQNLAHFKSFEVSPCLPSCWFSWFARWLRPTYVLRWMLIPPSDFYWDRSRRIFSRGTPAGHGQMLLCWAL